MPLPALLGAYAGVAAGVAARPPADAVRALIERPQLARALRALLAALAAAALRAAPASADVADAAPSAAALLAALTRLGEHGDPSFARHAADGARGALDVALLGAVFAPGAADAVFPSLCARQVRVAVAVMEAPDAAARDADACARVSRAARIVRALALALRPLSADVAPETLLALAARLHAAYAALNCDDAAPLALLLAKVDMLCAADACVCLGAERGLSLIHI